MINALRLFKIPSVVTLPLCAAGLVFISWYRAFIAGTMMVDGHNLQGGSEDFAFTAFLLALGFFSWAYYRLWADGNACLQQIKLLAYLLVCIFSFMLPMLSNDIFSYLVFGDAANHGADVYTNSQCTHFSTFFPYITERWAGSTSAYGPVTLLMTMLAAWAGAGKIAVAMIAFKVMVLLFAIVFIETAARVSALLQSPVKCFTFIVLNPVFLLQGVGQMHNDLMAIVFILLGIYFLLSGKWYFAFAMVGLSVAIKMNYVLLLPFFIVALTFQQRLRGVTYRMAGIGVLIVLVSLLAVYFPFYTSAATITTPFKFHYFQSPSRCIGEILGDVIYFAPQLVTGHKQELARRVNSVYGPNAQVIISMTIVKICQLFAVCLSLYIFIKFMRGEKTRAQWFRLYVRTVLLLLLYYLPIFNSWYLMMILPFMWVEDEPAFMHWLFALTCFISVQDIVCTVSRDSFVYVIVLVLTFISVALYMYKPRRMFVSTLGYN